MNRYINKCFVSLLLCAGVMASCSLDEYNPTELTTDDLSTFEGIEGMTSYCYQPLYGQLFTASDYLSMTEAGTDLWITKNNATNTAEFFYYEGLVTNTNASKKLMLQAYSVIDKCNTVIAKAEQAEGGTAADLKKLKGEAECLRAYYYSILVEQYGNITLSLTENDGANLNLRPERNSIEEIYAQIVQDLKDAAEDLDVKPYKDNYGRVSKKTALGLLARAYIQGSAYDLKEDGKTYVQRAKEVAEDLIGNMDSYDAYLYPTFEEVWLMKNNRGNKEALFVATGATPNGNADPYIQNNNSLYRYFLPSLNTYSDLKFIQNGYYYGRANAWLYAPTKYLLEVYSDYDKRYDFSFISAYSTYSYDKAGKSSSASVVKLTEKLCSDYGIDPKWVGTELGPQVNLLNNGWLYAETGAYRYPYETKPVEEGYVPYVYDDVKSKEGDVNLYTALNKEALKSGEEADLRIHAYFSRKAMSAEEKAERPYFVVTADEVYNENGYHVTAAETSNQLANLVPTMCKYMWYDADIAKTYQNRNGDMMIMRMAEVYLIAAEANCKLGDTDKAAEWINVLHKRACEDEDYVEGKMKVRASEINMDYILDEYARELCGEFQRWYILKRNKAFEDRLGKYNKRAAQSFESKHYVRPISSDFLNNIENADEYGTNGY